MSARTEGTLEDRAAIEQIVEHWGRAWETADASLLLGDYTEDAFWMNAFGLPKHGMDEIAAFIGELFAWRPHHEATFTRDPTTIRFVRPDVAVAHSRYLINWPDGRAPERRVNALRVFSKEGGRWLITDHMVMDERDPPPGAFWNQPTQETD